MKNLLLAAAAAISMVSAGAEASTLTYNLTAAGGTYTVTASVSTGDNFGLASYQFQLSNVATVNNSVAPLASYLNTSTFAQATVGFGFLLSTDNQTLVKGSQDTTAAPSAQAYGIGQTPGALTGPAGSILISNPTRSVYTAPVVLATGTYNAAGPLPSIALVGGNDAAGNLYTSNSSALAIAPTTVVLNQPSAVPEPASIAAIGLAGMGLMVRRRKTA